MQTKVANLSSATQRKLPVRLLFSGFSGKSKVSVLVYLWPSLGKGRFIEGMEYVAEKYQKWEAGETRPIIRVFPFDL